MSAFIVRIALNTPVIMNPVLTLDGLLARLAFDRLGDAEAALASLPLECVRPDISSLPEQEPAQPAPLRSALIHKASILFAEGPAPEAKVNMVRLARPGKTLTADMIRPGRGKKIPNILTHRGEFKNLLDNYTARMPMALWAFGRGDADAVRAALEGVKAIGKKRAQGWGEIAEVEVDRIEAPEAFGLMTADGKPARAVPIALWEEIGGSLDGITTTMAMTGFPRWACEPEFCAVPASVVVSRAALRSMMAC